MKSTGRRLLAGALWTYGLQVATVVIQLGYAALTSRLASPHAFGAYSVALSIMALVNLLGSGGLSQTAARATELTAAHLRPLSGYAVALGVVAALFTLLTEPLWTALWAAPSASGTVRLLALSALVVPMLSLCNGAFRRLGKFRSLALVTFASNLLGMVAGAVLVAVFRSPEALAVSAIVAQFATTAYAVIRLRTLLVPQRFSFRADNVRFSTKLVAVSVFQYVSGNAPRWSVSHFIGTLPLGAWNRADVLTTVPFSQVQAALLQVIYPEFRKNELGTAQIRSVWRDMLTLVSWLTLPAGAIVAAAGPAVTQWLLGPGWARTADYIPLLAALGAVQPLVQLLAAGLESFARFGAIWVSEWAALALSIGGAVVVCFTHDVFAALLAMLVGALVRHVAHISWAVHAGNLSLGPLLSSYATSLGAAMVVFLVIRGVVAPSPRGVPTQLIATLLLGAIVAIGLRFRHRLPPVAIARKRGILSPSLTNEREAGRRR